MLFVLRFKPSRFFLKGKARQEKQATSYIHKHTVREEVSQAWKSENYSLIPPGNSLVKEKTIFPSKVLQWSALKEASGLIKGGK